MERLLTRREVAEMIGVSENAVATAARAHRLGYIKVGNTYRFREVDVDAWVESMRVLPQPPAFGLTARPSPLAAARRSRRRVG